MLWKIMVFFLLVIIFALLLKIFYMRKAIREIKRGFSEKLYTDTNTPIMLSSHDKLVSSLANDINVELKELLLRIYPMTYELLLQQFAVT